MRGYRPAFFAVAVIGFSLTLAAARAAECPSDNVHDILNDPVVKDALKDAWEDSDEGTPDEHEEGGFILECVSISDDGSVVYELKIVRLPRGDKKQLKPTLPKLDEGCRIIAFFHTHPGPEKGHPQDDGFHNEEPSPQDQDWADATGLPGIIVYGTGPEYDDDTHTITFGRDSPLDYCKKPERKAGETKGDPHLTTFDGFVYSFQAVGEYVLAVDDDIELQARFEPIQGSTVASRTTALALRLGESVAMVRLDGELRLDGEVVDEFPAEVNGIEIEPGEGIFGRLLTFRWPDTTTIVVAWHEFLINVKVETLRFGWEGLFGDGDEDETNDLVGINGPLGERVDYAALYDELRPRWLVDAASSLFTYRAGESNASFFDPAFPSSVVGFADFEEAEVEQARDRCVDAMVWLSPYLEDCTYDYLVTRDLDVVAAAAAAQGQRFPLTDAGRIEDTMVLNGSIDFEGGGAIYLVEGAPGTLLSVSVDAIRGVSSCPRMAADFGLVILDGRGEEIGNAWPGNTGCLAYGPWEFPDDGRLAVLIESLDRLPADEEEPTRTGSFALTVGAPNGHTEVVTVGLDRKTTVSGDITIPLDFVDYRILGEPGDLVSATVTALNGIAACPRIVWDAELTALHPDGEEAGSGWPGNEGCKPYGGWEIPAAGELTVRVQGGVGAIAPTTGRYRLDIGRYHYDTVEVDSGNGSQRFRGSVDIPLDGTRYLITAPAGSEVSVEVVTMNGRSGCGHGVWDLRLFVSDLNGEPIGDAWPGNFGCSAFGPWIVPASGTLEILARGSDFAFFPATGRYELEVRFE